MSFSSSTESFGARLAAKRKARGLTQEQLGEGMAADGTDVGKGAVSSWEVSRTVPSTSQLLKLCQRLNCSADELLGVTTASPAATAGHDTGERRRSTDVTGPEQKAA